MMDYDNMPAGEEMDVEVARIVFGQTDFSHLETVYEEGNTPDGRDGWSGFVCPRCRTPVDMLNHPCVQNYSTDIAEAWKIMEHFAKVGKGMLIEFCEMFDGVFWTCANSNSEGLPLLGWGDGDNFVYSYADSAALAICRTALKLSSPKVD